MTDVMQTIEDAVVASADWEWTGDWNEPVLKTLLDDPPVPVVRARFAGFVTDVDQWRPAALVQAFVRDARARNAYDGLEELHGEFIALFDEAGVYPRRFASSVITIDLAATAANPRSTRSRNTWVGLEARVLGV